MSEPIRVLICDDHDIVRDGLRLILETSERLEVVGEAANGKEALRLAASARPDVVLMDLRMPEMDGLTAIRHLQTERPEMAVIILTTYNEDDLMLRGLQAGARGYLLKDVRREILISTIEAAARGESLLSPGLLQRVLAYQAEALQPKAEPASDLSTLSARELEVLRAAARGEQNKEIARAPGLSERTVKAHLTSVFNKPGWSRCVCGGRVCSFSSFFELFAIEISFA